MSTLRKWTTMTLRLGLLALSDLAFGTANAYGGAIRVHRELRR